MADYQLAPGGVFRESDGAFIPDDPDNRHWQEFISWEEGGGIPDPIPEPIPDPDAEALEALRAAAMEKIVTNAGLTEDEAAALFG